MLFSNELLASVALVLGFMLLYCFFDFFCLIGKRQMTRWNCQLLLFAFLHRSLCYYMRNLCE